MTKWDDLKAEMDKLTADLSDIGFVIEWAKLWNSIEEEGDKLQAQLWCLMEEHKDECCFWTPVGCDHPIKVTELCECPCELYWHPSYSKPVDSQQLRSNKDTPSPPQAEGVKGEKGK